MIVERKGFRVNGVLYDEMPDEMWQRIEKAFCEVHGLKIVEPSEKEPDDPPAA
jgi:hypothetical protein